MTSRRAGGAAALALALVASALVGTFAIRAVLGEAGRPAVPLDDVFIHFQYARRLAEGAPLRYTGDAISTGATSLVWPALLAPFWKMGARGLSLVWVAWALGTLAHAGVAVETALLAKRLTNGTGALAAGAMCIAFGPFAWFAWSGMETMAFAWILVRTTRLAAEVLDRGRADSVSRASGGALAVSPAPRAGLALSRSHVVQLAALGFLAPLVRPEGVLASLFAALALALRGERRRRGLALIPVLGCVLVPALFFALTGEATSATARVKWLVYNPYYDAGRLFAQLGYHARLLVIDVLDGGEWTWIFVPKGLVLVIFLGALASLRALRRAPWTVALTLALGLSVLVTCSYQTFLWNRVRYVWPFVPAGLVLCACLFHEVGQLLARLRRPLEIVTPALGAALVARLGAQLPTAIADLAQSARAVDQQQVKLAEWASASLPRDALIGVNDTGALAYFGERRTFDVVGLTTEGEARAWVAGAGSRFEHYERMPRAALPTHFVVYPEWFGCDALLGAELAHATVHDQAILGGDTMTAYTADFSLLGSGARPASLGGEALVDEVDVADLESEAAHGFVLGDAWDSDDVVGTSDVTEEREMVDGGRLARALDSFEVSAPAASHLELVMRLGADQPVTLRVRLNGQDASTLTLPKSPWIERRVELPSLASEPATAAERVRARIEVVALDAKGSPVVQGSREAGSRFASFHYWLYAR